MFAGEGTFFGVKSLDGGEKVKCTDIMMALNRILVSEP